MQRALNNPTPQRDNFDAMLITLSRPGDYHGLIPMITAGWHAVGHPKKSPHDVDNPQKVHAFDRVLSSPAVRPIHAIQHEQSDSYD